MKFTAVHEAIPNNMSEAVSVVDRTLRIQYTNPAAEKLTGYSFDKGGTARGGDER